ncbi:protodermal factor 1 [Malania oleifera]|uniref:protodermal factor 1 n=1 Tax=Malania oleifera TaxID=397392 RepID=UPI0025AEA211|nr:protodermal factor 1 [Malania oleifera]
MPSFSLSSSAPLLGLFQFASPKPSMMRDTSKQASLFMWIFVMGLLSQNLLIPVMSTSFEDQKNYYPDPRPVTPPHGSRTSPPLGISPKPECRCGDPPPSHGITPPSHGGGSYYSPPPTPRSRGQRGCGTPPSPKKGGGGGGGYYSPPPSGGSSPPTPVVYYSPPTAGGSPPTPVVVTPPSTPTVSVPPPPFLPDPNSPFTGTCNYWKSHPALIWGLFGWWATVGGAFGLPSVSEYGAGLSLLDALSNTRSDGLGALYREGTASLLNSMVSKKFHFTTKQVKNSFIAAVGSNKAAAAQANIFKLANEGRLKPKT